MQLLLIEDGHNPADWLAEQLGETGFAVSRIGFSREALADSPIENVQAIVIDLGQSGIDGRVCVRHLREAGFDQPLLILSPLSNWREKVDCLNAGADEFLVKPVRGEEVIARLHAIIRRFAGCSTDRMKAGDAELDLKARRAWIAGEPLDLTRNEFRLLRLFIMRPERFLSSEELLDQLYARKQDRGTNSVEVQIARLRRKIGKDRIQTMRGVGYRLIPGLATQQPALGEGAGVAPDTGTPSIDSWAPQI
jgi:two-component system OmpR family response regulator